MGDHRIHLVAAGQGRLQLLVLPHDDALRLCNKHMMRHPRNQLLVIERLRHVIAGPHLEPFDNVFRIVERREKNHGNPAESLVGLEPLDHLITVHVRHHDIQQNQVRRFAFDLFEPLRGRPSQSRSGISPCPISLSTTRYWSQCHRRPISYNFQD